MKTLVIVDMPGKVLSLPLTDLVSTPTQGRFYVFEGKRYEVTEVTEFLGFRDSVGKEVGTNGKLLQLLKVVYNGDDVKAAFVVDSMCNIGSIDTNATTPGGIIMPMLKLRVDFDSAIFVRVKPVKGEDRPSIKLNALAETGDKQSLVDGDGDGTQTNGQ